MYFKIPFCELWEHQYNIVFHKPFPFKKIYVYCQKLFVFLDKSKKYSTFSYLIHNCVCSFYSNLYLRNSDNVLHNIDQNFIPWRYKTLQEMRDVLFLNIISLEVFIILCVKYVQFTMHIDEKIWRIINLSKHNLCSNSF